MVKNKKWDTKLAKTKDLEP